MHTGGKRFSTDEEVEKWTKELAGNNFEEAIKNECPVSAPALRGMVSM